MHRLYQIGSGIVSRKVHILSRGIEAPVEDVR